MKGIIVFPNVRFANDDDEKVLCDMEWECDYEQQDNGAIVIVGVDAINMKGTFTPVFLRRNDCGEFVEYDDTFREWGQIKSKLNNLIKVVSNVPISMGVLDIRDEYKQ